MNLEIKIPSDEPVRLLSPEGKSAPDHNTIARFRREHLPYAVEDLLNQMVKLLVECGEISFEESVVFIDGTKIEANVPAGGIPRRSLSTRGEHSCSADG